MAAPRNDKGQWAAGVSGNTRGRPRREATPYHGLTHQLREAMSQKIPVVDARGKRRMVPAYEAAVQQLVRSIPHLKPNELMKAMQWMQDLQVFGAESRDGLRARDMTPEQRKQTLMQLLGEARANEALQKEAPVSLSDEITADAVAE